MNEKKRLAEEEAEEKDRKLCRDDGSSSSKSLKRQHTKTESRSLHPSGTSFETSGDARTLEEEEEEPQLTYSTLGGDAAAIVSKEGASCLYVAERFLALGTKQGSIYLLDFQGNKVRSFPSLHSSPISSLSLNASSETMAAASASSVVLHSLFSQEEDQEEEEGVEREGGERKKGKNGKRRRAVFTYSSGVLCVALDPEYEEGRREGFAVGCESGEVVLNTKGWLGNRDQVLHSGEGPVAALSWHWGMLAWANDRGVKVFGVTTQRKMAFVERPGRVGESASWHTPQLTWQDERTLLIGWENCIKVVRITSSLSSPPSSSSTPNRLMEVVGVLKLPCCVLGILPYSSPSSSPSSSSSSSSSSTSSHSALILSTALPTPKPKEEPKEDAKGADEGAKEEAGRSAPCGCISGSHLRLHTVALPENGGRIDPVPGLGLGLGLGLVSASSLPSSSSSSSREYGIVSAEPSPGGFVDGEDTPVAYVMTPGSLLLVRNRGLSDHIRWLLQRNSFSKALAAIRTFSSSSASTHSSLPPSLQAQVSTLYLEHLLSQKRYEEAAEESPSLLSTSGQNEGHNKANPAVIAAMAAAWERIIVLFAAQRQLHLLLPHIPTKAPQLSKTIYQLVLDGLLSRSSDHLLLLQTIQRWPSHLYDPKGLIKNIKLRMEGTKSSWHGRRKNRKNGEEGRLSSSSLLPQVLAELYMLEGDTKEALAIYLESGSRERQPGLFDFLEQQKHQFLIPTLKDKVVALLRLDEGRAVKLLLAHRDDIPPGAVVAQLDAQLAEECEEEDKNGGGKRGEKDEEEGEIRFLRRLMHLYLHGLFLLDSNAGTEFHERQVSLYAEFDPQLLLPFLRTSQAYQLDKAFQICAFHGLLEEQVFVLGRMGNVRAAMAILMDKMHNVQQAIEFAVAQQDEELWMDLIEYAMKDGYMAGELLEHSVGNVDPLHLMEKLPLGAAIPKLRDRLVQIVADFGSESKLRQGCNAILKSDCVDLLVRYLREAKKAVWIGEDLADLSISGASHELKMKQLDLLASKRKNGRCCVCLERFVRQSSAIVVFFCTHAYHRTCLQAYSESAGPLTSNDKKSMDRLHCTICSAAATVKSKAALSTKMYQE